MLILLVVVVGCTAFGCGTRMESTQPAKAVSQPLYGWYQTHGDGASQVLVTKVSIPGLFQEKTEEIRIAKYVRVNADGLMQFPPEMVFGMTNADGRNEKGGFGYGGAINVISDNGHEDAIVLDVNYYWTTPDQIKGQLKEKVPVKIGVPLDVKLPGDCWLQVSWRAIP